LPKRARCVLVLPDAHYPHVDETCEAIVIKAAELLRPDEVVILGDWADLGAFSSHDPTTWDEAEGVVPALEEYTQINAAMARIERAAGGCKFTYLEGNHEYRAERMALKLGGQLGRSVYRALSPKHHLRTKSFHWVPYTSDPSQSYRIAPDLLAVHGWTASKYAAAAHLNKAKTVSGVFGHCHRQQEFTECDLEGRPIVWWSPGFLGKRGQFYYSHKYGPVSWAHGFSIVYQSQDPEKPIDWVHYTVKIKDGYCVLPDGRKVRV